MKATHMLGMVLCAACGATPTTTAIQHPSAAEYDAKAAREEAAARADREKYDPNAHDYLEHCTNNHSDTTACWTADFNPTGRHLKEADEHRRAAARYRALSQVLRDVEATQCTGLTEHDRDMSPFAHVEDIINIEPLDVPAGKSLRREGAAFTFRPMPGMNAAWMEKVVRCHLARNDAMGHAVPHMDYCPLVPPNVDARVRDSSMGIVVEVSSGNPATVTEILRRAELLQEMRSRIELPK
jgi:hypothetical protein